jgi:hypothetical protein
VDILGLDYENARVARGGYYGSSDVFTASFSRGSSGTGIALINEPYRWIGFRVVRNK